jgi:transposase
VVERTFAWATRFRRLVREYERSPQTLADMQVIALVCLMLKQVANYARIHNSLY